MATDSSEFEKSIRIPYQKDGFDDVRAEYSQMLRQQLAKGNNGLTKTKFITFGVEGESMRQVKARLDHIQNDLLNNFHRLGVQAKPLNGAERLKLMHDCAHGFCFQKLPNLPDGRHLLRRQFSEHYSIRHQRPASERFPRHGFLANRHNAHSVR